MAEGLSKASQNVAGPEAVKSGMSMVFQPGETAVDEEEDRRLEGLSLESSKRPTWMFPEVFASTEIPVMVPDPSRLARLK
jgi:hypothetical protein